jgi:hypothetical protein
MRRKILNVLFIVLTVSTFAVVQSSTSGSSSGSSAGSSSTGTSTGTGNTGSFLNSSPRDVQVPSNSGIGNVTVNPTTPSTLMFNTQNLNSPSAIDSSSGSPTTDQILSLQNDLISSTSSFLNGSSSTTNNRTSTSVLGQTIFGNSIVPGMTNVPIVSVVPSAGPLVIGSTNSNSNPQ